jgi:hypothetical protein
VLFQALQLAQESEEGILTNKAKQYGARMNNKAMKQQWGKAMKYLKMVGNKVQRQGSDT